MKIRRVVIAMGCSIGILLGSSSSVFAAEFDPTFYANMYPDVVLALGNSTDALYNHYITYGMSEGRYPYAGAAPGEKTDGIKAVDSSAADSAESMSVFTPVAINKLANYRSLKKKMTDEEFQLAYNAALQIVTPLAGKSREEQLLGIAIAVRNMLCLFSAIYLLAEVALDSEQFVFKKIFKKYFGGLFYIVLAVMMSGFSLLPVYYEISGSRMKESSLRSTFYMLKNLDSRMWELGNKLCIGTYNVHQLKSGLPNIYAGCLCFVLFILFFVSRKYKVSKKEKIIYAITCVVLLLSFVSVGVNMIWHGFAQANGSPYRYSFFVSFLMIEIASRQYLKIQEGQEMVRKKDAAELVNIGIAAILGAFLLYKGFVQYKIDESDYLNLSQILLTVGFILVWFILLKLRKSHKMMIGTYKSYCMLFFLIIELGLNMGIDISHFSYEKIGEYQAYVQETESVLKQIRKLDADPFYRIENDIRYEQRNCNDAMLLGYPSITHYSSVLPYSVSKYASEEGMSSYPGSLSVVYKKEEANAEAAGRNGIKYLITKSLPDNMQGWTLFSQDASVNILKNTAYQPMIRFENEKCETRIESVENGKIATKLFNENEKPEKLIILIPWHQGWQLKLDGKDIVPDKYKSAMMEVMIPTGNHEFTMNFHPVYLKEGTIVSVISTVLFFGLLFVNHRKSRKRLLILPERGIIY